MNLNRTKTKYTLIHAGAYQSRGEHLSAAIIASPEAKFLILEGRDSDRRNRFGVRDWAAVRLDAGDSWESIGSRWLELVRAAKTGFEWQEAAVALALC